MTRDQIEKLRREIRKPGEHSFRDNREDIIYNSAIDAALSLLPEDCVMVPKSSTQKKEIT